MNDLDYAAWNEWVVGSFTARPEQYLGMKNFLSCS